MGKAILPASTAVSCRGSKLHRKRSGCQRKHCLLSHPRTNCVPRHGGSGTGGHSRSASWNCFSLPTSKADPSKRRPSPRAPAVILNLLFPSPRAKRLFRKRRGNIQTNETHTPRWDAKGQGAPGSHAVTRLFQISALQGHSPSAAAAKGPAPAKAEGTQEAPTVPGPSTLPLSPPGRCHEGAPREPRVL